MSRKPVGAAVGCAIYTSYGFVTLPLPYWLPLPVPSRWQSYERTVVFDVKPKVILVGDMRRSETH
jgi:hypothetical protein